MTAKIAGLRELLHAAVVAIVQTMALVWGFTAGEYASLHTGVDASGARAHDRTAMMLGASIRARATANH